MRIVRDLSMIDPDTRGAVAAIGNFDGVHLGHQAVIDAAAQVAVALDAPLGVMTFEPHPRNLFVPDAPPFRLMNAESRADRLARLGIDLLFEVPFNRDLVALTPHDFARQIICDGLGLRHVVVGTDFCFGKDRAGDAAALQAFGTDMGFGVTVAPMVALDAGRVSSTAIRQVLADGDPRAAARMLGHWHRIAGPVQHGEKRGRDMGYPTANLAMDGLHLPKLGVYAVLIDIADGPQAGQYHGVASLGVRPMFGENQPNFETFIFDFDGDLYGQHISVALVEFLRPEVKFTTVDNLIAQMDADSVQARDVLSNV